MNEKKLPEPLYCCCNCCEDHTWPAEDLWWSDLKQNWYCHYCWDAVDEHWDDGSPIKVGISLAKELKRRGLNR